MSAIDATGHLRIERDGAVETITIDRPERMNATSYRTGLLLRDAVRAAAADGDVRAIVLTGAGGRAFSAGADLREMDGPVLESGGPDVELVLREAFNPLILAIREAPKPVVSAVCGVAVGVGCSIALAADLVVAGDSATFIAGFTQVGLSPDGGLSHLLTARIGPVRAAEALLLNTPVGAQDALAWGLVNRVVADDALPATAAELAGRLAAGAPGALAAAKRLQGGVIDAGLAEVLDLEAASQGERARSAEFAEGVAAFLERRAPNYA
ncbi:MAG: enoyl-CoA hydratase-related protein [Patulibacter minatonensis]